MAGLFWSKTLNRRFELSSLNLCFRAKLSESLIPGEALSSELSDNS